MDLFKKPWARVVLGIVFALMLGWLWEWFVAAHKIDAYTEVYITVAVLLACLCLAFVRDRRRARVAADSRNPSAQIRE